MAGSLRTLILPERQRRTLEELTDELDLRVGDRRSRYTAFWTMLLLSAIIASAGVLADSSATVIGAMIIAPLSTPILGTALALAKRERTGSMRFVLGGVLLVVVVGLAFSPLVPNNQDLLDNGQISGRTSPSMLDMIAALATGLAGAVAMARRDVAAVLPGVAVAISLVPPLAVVGICLGNGQAELALGAALLFVSNLLALVLAGTFVFAVLGYADQTLALAAGSRVRQYAVLTGLIALVSVPLVLNSVVTFALAVYADRVQAVAQEWLADVPGANVTGVDYHGRTITVEVESIERLPRDHDLADRLAGQVPAILQVTVHGVVGETVELTP